MSIGTATRYDYCAVNVSVESGYEPRQILNCPRVTGFCDVDSLKRCCRRASCAECRAFDECSRCLDGYELVDGDCLLVTTTTIATTTTTINTIATSSDSTTKPTSTPITARVNTKDIVATNMTSTDTLDLSRLTNKTADNLVVLAEVFFFLLFASFFLQVLQHLKFFRKPITLLSGGYM